MASGSKTDDQQYESIVLIKPEVNVYVIPPRQSTTRKHRAADWKLDTPNFLCRLKIVTKADRCLIRLEDRNTGAHFATCPVETYPSIAVENVEDSTRYFVIRVQNDQGQQAFLGVGFADRSDSFDFNVALQDHFKHVKQTETLSNQTPIDASTPKVDWSFKEGQTIRINLKNSFTGENPSKKCTKSSNEPFLDGVLPPPPPSAASNTTPIAPKSNTQPDSNWIQF